MILSDVSSNVYSSSSSIPYITLFSGLAATFLAYTIIYALVATSNTIRITNLYAIPENNGSSAISCATPTLNGLRIPAVNPTAAPSAIIAVPVTLSSPRNSASVIPIGTNIITSDDIPIVKPNIENSVKNTGITTYLCFENVFESFLQSAVSAPVDVIT